MATEVEAWRRQWRGLGLAVDRLLSICFGIPSPTLSELHGRVPRAVNLPIGSKYTLTDDDVQAAAASADFMAAYVAEALPTQVVDNDLKPRLPAVASRFAVRSLRGGDKEYVGSFDVLLRMRVTRRGIWHDYANAEMAVDCTITGVESTLGLNGLTLRSYFQNAQTVLGAARAQKLRIGDCRMAAFLLRRPPGRTLDGRIHAGDVGFVAFDVDRLLSWDPRSVRPPLHVGLYGNLLHGGRDAMPDPVTLVNNAPVRPPPRDRWAELGQLKVRNGWVTVKNCVRTFGLIGRQTEKKATEKALKRLRKQSPHLEDHADGVGRPENIARFSDLQIAYPGLT